MATIEINALAVHLKSAAAAPFVYRAEAGPHDVLVRLTHRTLTRGDVQFIDNDWNDTSYPLVPGHEMVGDAADVVRADGVLGHHLRPAASQLACRRPWHRRSGPDRPAVPSRQVRSREAATAVVLESIDGSGSE